MASKKVKSNNPTMLVEATKEELSRIITEKQQEGWTLEKLGEIAGVDKSTVQRWQNMEVNQI